MQGVTQASSHTNLGIMPDEEMEITTDLAQPGFAEDIDIDLDFAQPDEDMELADFDQAQDIQNFNSDARDELMAEGDDESFGMIDAEDIMHNEAAAAANDIEIDIGGPDDDLLPEVTAFDGASHQVDELDYAEVLGTEDQNIESGDWFQASADQVSGSAEVQVDYLEDPAAATAVDATSAPGTTLPSAEIDLQGSTTAGEAEQTDESLYAAQFQDATGQENLEHAEEHADSGTSYEVEHSDVLETSKDSSNRKVDEKHDDEPNSEEQPGEEAEESREADVSKPVKQGQLQDGATGTESDLLAGDNFEEEQFAEESNFVADLNATENHLGGESYDEHTNDENNAVEGDEDKTSLNNPDLENELEAQNDYTDAYQEGTDRKETQGIQDEFNENVASIAKRHELHISYGETDYRLFAKSEDDDPNQYFLKDTSALELSLAEFLTSLRDVISEEVSPLDELVMHVDGLGLEFAESTTSDFLEKFTFGNILKLYDNLVKNDEAETPPDLYCYLMVRPNCRQRLMALQDSANSGRGLSEIALYRETTPFDEAHGSEPGSPAVSVSLDDEAADGTYESNEVDAEQNGLNEDAHENHSVDDTAELQDDFESESVGANVAALDPMNHTDAISQNPAEAAKETINSKSEDDLLDFSDDELDLSPSKEDDPVQSPSKNQATSAVKEDQTSQETEIKATDGHTPPATSPNGRTDAPNSDNTSVTATLNGDDHDEIDYSDDEEDIGNKDEATDTDKALAPPTLKAPNDEEITWESDNEDANNGIDALTSKKAIQVSSPHGKRSRSESDDVDGEGEQSDVKRRRS